MNSLNAQRLKELLAGNLDWDQLLNMAQQHGILPLLYLHFQEIIAEVAPQSVWENLRASYHDTVYRNLWRAKELRKLMQLLEAHGIEALAFKGPALAVLAYGDLTLRPFLDLDILIRERDLARARQIMLVQRYQHQASQPLTKPQQRLMRRRQHHDIFRRADGQSMVELHWALFNPRVAILWEFKYLWERRRFATIAGAPIPTLAQEDLLLYLCIHGAEHFWRKLKWICDLAELLRACPQMDWPSVMAGAKELGCERRLWLGLFLARDLLGTPLTQEIEAQMASDAAVKTLAAQVRASLGDDAGAGGSLIQKSLFQIRARQRLLDRGRYSFRFLEAFVGPQLADWERLRLPSVLFPCYHLVGSLRLAGRYSARMLKAVFRRR